MTVDILIPTYKPGPELEKLLRMLQKQTVTVRKIIVMNTEEKFFERFMYERPAIAQMPQLEVHHLTRREFDHGGTRHRGMQYSQADICICMTQDAMPLDEYLIERLIAPLRDEKVAVSYARQLPGPDSGALEQFTRSFNYPAEPRLKSLEDVESMGIKAYFCSDVCAAYNRDTYQKLGGFVRRTIFNEDMIFAAGAMKAGYCIYYAADAQVIHSHEYGFMQQLRRNFDLGVSQAEHPEVFAEISSEKEGKRMVLTACKHFIKIGKPFEIVHLITQSGAKYIGYYLGKRYQKLPKGWIKKCTASRAYWDK